MLLDVTDDAPRRHISANDVKFDAAQPVHAQSSDCCPFNACAEIGLGAGCFRLDGNSASAGVSSVQLQFMDLQHA